MDTVNAIGCCSESCLVFCGPSVLLRLASSPTLAQIMYQLDLPVERVQNAVADYDYAFGRQSNNCTAATILASPATKPFTVRPRTQIPRKAIQTLTRQRHRYVSNRVTTFVAVLSGFRPVSSRGSEISGAIVGGLVKQLGRLLGQGNFWWTIAERPINGLCVLSPIAL